MTTTTTTLEQARNTYRTLRAGYRHELPPARFDSIARDIAMELADGEEIEPQHYLTAARMIVSGMRHA